MFQSILFNSKWTRFDILLSTFLCTLFIWYIQFLWGRRKLYMEARKVPGPFGWPLVGSALYLLVKPEDVFNSILKLIKPYPETSKIWFGSRLYFFTYDPKHIGVLLTKCIAKDQSYQKAEFLIGRGIFAAPMETWKKNRKLICPAFNLRILDAYVEVFNYNAEVLVKVLEKFCGKGEFDILDIASKCTLDSGCETAVGVRTNFQTNDSSLPKAVECASEILFMRSTSIWYQSDLLFQFSRHAKEFEQAAGQFHEFTGKVVRERMNAFEMEKQHERKFRFNGAGEERRWKPFLDHLIEMSHQEKAYLSYKEIRDEIDTFLIAATDTTATALCFCFSMLGLYPEIQERGYTEVLSVVGPDRAVESTDLAHLKYLDLFIKETMRVFPPAAFFTRAANEDIDLGPFIVPKGSSVAICTAKLHMNEKYWPDPYKFRPERFLPEEVAERHPCAYIPFFYGPRNCIGQRYAMMTLKTTLSTVVRKFKLFTSYRKLEDIKVKSIITIKPIEGFKVSLGQR